MAWSNILGMQKPKEIKRVVKVKRFVSKSKGAFDYAGAGNLRSALCRGKGVPVCSECGWRACSCNRTLDEWY